MVLTEGWLGRRAERKAREASRTKPVTGAARAGLAARGALYVVVGLLALRVAAGDRSEEADKQGALEAVARQPLGRLLAAAVAVGLAGYAVWRLVQAVGGPRDGDGGPKAWAKRAAHVARAGLYAFLAYSAARVVAGGGAGGGSEEERDATARVLAWPLGPWLVAAVGAAFCAAAAYNAWRAATGDYRDDLEEGRMDGGERRALCVSAVAGLLARTVVFGLVGLFLLRAAWQHDPGETVGLDGALRRVAGAPAGPVLLGALAAGLLAFGLFSLFQARYRRVSR